MFNDSIPGATCHCGGYLQEKDTNSNWVERLIDFRKTKRYSQHLLSMFIGVSQSQLSKMAKGETPVTPQVIKYLEKNGG
jgi:ribosome-binding protein aMBF1 (putative translation factor)